MNKWDQRRREPYTVIGISRLRCIRCGAPAKFQWSICADGNNHRPLCLDCDVALNRMVLVWMRHPNAEKLATEYALRKAVENDEA
jgi:NAD-dependent SIR2 family protein deacetylase